LFNNNNDNHNDNDNNNCVYTEPEPCAAPVTYAVAGVSEMLPPKFAICVSCEFSLCRMRLKELTIIVGIYRADLIFEQCCEETKESIESCLDFLRLFDKMLHDDENLVHS